MNQLKRRVNDGGVSLLVFLPLTRGVLISLGVRGWSYCATLYSPLALHSSRQAIAAPEQGRRP